MAEKLLNCPFCGGDELSHGYVAAGGMEWGTCGCEACGSHITAGTEAQAIADWNKRAPSPEAVRLKEAFASLFIDPHEPAATWMQTAGPLIERFEVAAAFDQQAVHNPTGSDALAKLIKAMAQKLDFACDTARAALSHDGGEKA